MYFINMLGIYHLSIFINLAFFLLIPCFDYPNVVFNCSLPIDLPNPFHLLSCQIQSPVLFKTARYFQDNSLSVALKLFMIYISFFAPSQCLVKSAQCISVTLNLNHTLPPVCLLSYFLCLAYSPD